MWDMRDSAPAKLMSSDRGSASQEIICRGLSQHLSTFFFCNTCISIELALASLNSGLKEFSDSRGQHCMLYPLPGSLPTGPGRTWQEP